MTVYVNPALRAAIERVSPSATVENCALMFSSILYIKASEMGTLTPANVSRAKEFFPMHSTISRNIYTARIYGPMLQVLDEVGAIQVKRGGSYQVGNTSKRYRLAPQFWSVVPIQIDAPRLEARTDRFFSLASYAAMKGPAREWIMKSFQSTSFSSGAATVLADKIFRTLDARHRAENHVANVVNQRLRFHVSKASGRIYYCVANLPKVVRQELLIDGEATAEIDIACSQPSLLASLYDLDNPAHVVERSAYLALLLSGTFYEQLAPGKDWDRPRIKKAFFNEIAYGSYYCSGKYELLPSFTARFPILAGLMARIKRGGNAVLPVMMQTLEAGIVIDGAGTDCAKAGLMILPVHDSLICKASEALAVAEIFKRNWDGRTNIPARFQISQKGTAPMAYPSNMAA